MKVIEGPEDLYLILGLHAKKTIDSYHSKKSVNEVFAKVHYDALREECSDDGPLDAKGHEFVYKMRQGMLSTPKDGGIYAVAVSSGYIKIGQSVCIDQRISNLRATDIDVRLVAKLLIMDRDLIPHVEKGFHRKFHHLRYRRELFRPSGELFDELKDWSVYNG